MDCHAIHAGDVLRVHPEIKERTESFTSYLLPDMSSLWLSLDANQAE